VCFKIKIGKKITAVKNSSLHLPHHERFFSNDSIFALFCCVLGFSVFVVTATAIHISAFVAPVPSGKVGPLECFLKRTSEVANECGLSDLRKASSWPEKRCGSIGRCACSTPKCRNPGLPAPAFAPPRSVLRSAGPVTIHELLFWLRFFFSFCLDLYCALNFGLD